MPCRSITKLYEEKFWLYINVRNPKPTAMNLNHKKVLAIILLLIVQATSFAQNQHTIDSLKNIIDNPTEDMDVTTIIHAYLDLSCEYEDFNLDTAFYYSDLALKKSLNINYKRGIADAYEQKGAVAVFLNDYKLADSLLNIALSVYSEINHQYGIMKCYISLSRNAYYKAEYHLMLEYCTKALKIAEELNDEKRIPKIYNNIGIVYEKWGHYEKAIEYYNNSLETSQKIGDKQGIAQTLNNIGNVYKNQGHYEKAIEYYNNSLKTSQKIGDKQGIARILNNIGLVYNNWGNYEKTIEYYNNSLKISQKIGDKQGIAATLNNIGNVYEKWGNYEKTIEYYEKSLEIKKELGNEQRISTTLNNIGIVYENQGNYKKAIEYYYNSLKISQKIGDKQGIAATLNCIGGIYEKLGDYEKAINFFNKSLKIAQPLNLKELIYNDYQGLSEVNSALGNHQKALEYYKQYTAVKDSVFNKESSKKIAEMEVRYETEKKDNKIKLLEKNQKIQVLKFDKERRIKNTFTIAFILVSVFIFILSYLYIQKQKAYKIIVKHNIELAKKDIEFEKIGYGAKIQRNTKINNKQDENKYSGSVLNENQKQKLLQDIILLMEVEKKFLNPQFTVEDCAKELHTNRRYISQVINEYHETNFNNFVNEYRVKEARKLLVNPEFNNYSLNGIASMSGFHSRATFNSAFKKYTGLTPSYFKRKNS